MTQRCEIELLDPTASDGVLIVRGCRINGEEVYLPQDAQITMTAGPKEAVKVTITLFPTKLTVGEP